MLGGMFLTLRTTLRARFVVRVIVRTLAACLLAWAAYRTVPIVTREPGFYIRSVEDSLLNAGNPNYRPPARVNIAVRLVSGIGSLISLLPLFISGAALLVFEKRIARWLIPVPTWHCPKCGFELVGTAPALCTECGLKFGDDGGASKKSSGVAPGPE
jgi:hypothetical protein